MIMQQILGMVSITKAPSTVQHKKMSYLMTLGDEWQ